MAEKKILGRLVQKHDIESNWKLAVNFTPMQGEIIIYDIDSNYSYERLKIGDGVKNVNALPFVDDALRDTILEQITSVDDKVNAISDLVGDEKVSDQIEAANIIYVGPDRPTNPNIKVWINTAEDGTGVTPVLPRLSTISLPVNGWIGGSSPYSQVVEINTVTTATKIDLQPTVAQIVSLQNDDIALMATNNGGEVTIYAFGGKPSTNMEMQVLLTEVSYV